MDPTDAGGLFKQAKIGGWDTGADILTGCRIRVTVAEAELTQSQPLFDKLEADGKMQNYCTVQYTLLA